MGYIYQLLFANGKSYVGMTTRTVEERYAEHADTARRGKRTSSFYRAWRKHGAPELRVLAQAAIDTLAGLEQDFVLALGTICPAGYNSTTGGEVSPMLFPEVRAKAFANMRGKKHKPRTPEDKARIAAALKGRPSKLRGRKCTAEHRANMSRGRMGLRLNETQRAALLAANVGRPKSQATRDKISATLTGRSSGRKGIPCSEATKAKIAATLRARHAPT